MTFEFLDVWWWPYLFILAAGWFPTAIWRYLGVYFAGGIDENAEILVLVRALATALVASVIAKMILYPEGSLGSTPVLLRIFCAAAGFSIYWFAGKRVGAGVLAGLLPLVAWMLVFN